MQEEPTTPPNGAKPGAVLSTTQARQAVTTGRVRYVLAISTVLAIIGMVVAYIVI
jgi:hypothetical protein